MLFGLKFSQNNNLVMDAILQNNKRTEFLIIRIKLMKIKVHSMDGIHIKCYLETHIKL